MLSRSGGPTYTHAHVVVLVALIGLPASACRAAPAPEEEEDETAADLSEPDLSDPEPTLSLDALEATVAAALGSGLPEPLTSSAWLWALAEEESASADPCFQITRADTDSSVSWQGTCAQEDGDDLSGTLLLSVRDEATAEGVRRVELSYLASLDGVQAGSAWEVGGTGAAMLQETAAGVAFTAEVGGTYGLDTGWARDEIDTSLAMVGAPTDLGSTLTLTGGLTPPGEASLYFWDLVIDAVACPDAPFGLLSVRDPSSVWFNVAFDGACTGCGVVFWMDEPIGEICPGAAIVDEGATVLAIFEEALTR